MKYIKINTPLQVVSGFVVNEAIVVFTGRIEENLPNVGLGTIPILIRYLYKDFSAFDRNELPIKLKNELPEFNVYDYVLKVLRSGDVYNDDDLYTEYLSILKQNEYDAEIVDTDATDVKFIFKGEKPDGKIIGYIVEKYFKKAEQKSNEAKDDFFKSDTDKLKEIIDDKPVDKETIDKEVVKRELRRIDSFLNKIQIGLQNVNIDYDSAAFISNRFRQVDECIENIASTVGFKFTSINHFK